MNVIAFFRENATEILMRSGQHLMLAVIATLIATVTAVPVGIWLTRKPAWRNPVLGFAGVLQTIPSLALLGFLIPLPLVGGIGAKAALVALVLYALVSNRSIPPFAKRVWAWA
jgi:osmoprotectant transport system permease protein